MLKNIYYYAFLKIFSFWEESVSYQIRRQRKASCCTWSYPTAEVHSSVKCIHTWMIDLCPLQKYHRSVSVPIHPDLMWLRVETIVLYNSDSVVQTSADDE